MNFVRVPFGLTRPALEGKTVTGGRLNIGSAIAKLSGQEPPQPPPAPPVNEGGCFSNIFG